MALTYLPEPLAIRHDADVTDGADATPTGLHTDAAGRLKVSTSASACPVVTGNLSAAAGAVALDVSRCAGVVVHAKGVFAGVAAVFEASLDSTNGVDGTWFGAQASRSNANIIETATGTMGSSPTYAWELSTNGYRWFRVRHTAWTSGTATWVLSPTTHPTEPVPAIPAHPVTGSGSFAIVPAATSVLVYSLTTAASTNAASVKATAGSLMELTVSNPTATPAFVKLYDKATAPTVGTDVPKVTIPVAAGAIVALNLGLLGKRFSVGIALAVTAAAAATDVAVAVAGVQIHGTYY